MSYQRDQALFDSFKVPHQVVAVVTDTVLTRELASSFTNKCLFTIIMGQHNKINSHRSRKCTQLSVSSLQKTISWLRISKLFCDDTLRSSFLITWKIIKCLKVVNTYLTALSLHRLKFSRYKKWPLFFYFLFILIFLFSSIFICFKGILKHIRDVFITQKHLGILRLPRPWSHPITSLWSSFPLVISNHNSCGYCLLKESRPHMLFLFDQAIITDIVTAWNFITVITP